MALMLKKPAGKAAPKVAPKATKKPSKPPVDEEDDDTTEDDDDTTEDDTDVEASDDEENSEENSDSSDDGEDSDDDSEEDEAPPPKKKTVGTPAKKVAAGKTGFKFLKRGKEAQDIAKVEDKKAQARRNQIFEYRLPPDGSGSVTFLDGDLDEGILDVPYFHMHRLNMGGNKWKMFICTQDEEPCPICDGGDNASYVGILTVIDHSVWKDKDGKTHKDEQRLFIAKRDTIKLLQASAVKRNGLRGCKFDTARGGKTTPSVGNSFDFTEKLSEKALTLKYKEKATPVNYDKYLAGLYMSAKELKKMGFGTTGHTVGAEAADEEDYDM